MAETPLDAAHAAMDANPGDDAARLRFYERLAESELVLMLSEEPKGDALSPEIFDLGDARFVLVFDREERLAQFAGKPVPYAALSGRALARLAAEQAIGLAVNPEVAPSSILLPPEALAWLVSTLEQDPQEADVRVETLGAPGDLPDTLLGALDRKLAAMAGLARKAYLASVTYSDGTRGHLLGITGAVDGAEPALARAIQEALVFSGLEAGALDVTFLGDADPRAAELARVALRFDLPEPPKVARQVMQPPGSDPEKPPILK
ncbi:SseB family protein [Cognatishimia sp. F0-27]|uniref:SseB family protein n=1 Tax=Cognatishimia sp. F0-27 TaxID=2816855 RepID=UPI001D0C7F51|nr:SseB family protein [Cognatishimia sp. F0-27]MCC1492797.1 SseB family protein [Cognatishimia sp. F0-27]